VGRVRHNNEDHILLRPELGLYVVCDGMGGNNAGEVASALASVSVRNFFEATTADTFVDLDGDDLTPHVVRLTKALEKANSDVNEIATTHPAHRGMGCTIVALSIPPPGDWAHIAHIGDSRCYRIRQGKIEQLTRDHSLISDLLALKPDLTPAELSHLPRNIVTRAVGVDPTVQVDIRTEEVEPGDVFLLCSDGLTGMLEDDEIVDILAHQGDPTEAAGALIAMANEAGGHDNVSAIVVRIG
jgi:protein phosphatase